MPITQISPEEAKALLDGDNSHIYIDVRSEGEFQQAHPTGSYNVPVQHLNIAIQQLQDNEEFTQVMQANFPKDAKLILCCGSGIRSQRACELLERCGYESLFNVDGGFSGARDMYGTIAKMGWMQLGYPVDNGNDDERGYETLKDKTA
ncbi:MAG: rhodanese-like domain-containing protein [Proteobacteria bacterium]|nr:rhodanese-like domain-containing protein [Pseudomonadota bacterium]